MSGGNIEGKKSGGAVSEKYFLRPRESFRQRKPRKRFDDEFDAKSSLTKRKPQPINKYRRKTANARERSRMREINVAFETLRRAVPSQVPQFAFHSDGTNEKLTKITTLRLAMSYIAELVDLLRNKERRSDLHERIDSYVNCCIFRHGNSDTMLNSTRNCVNSEIRYFTDSGSDSDTFHSATTMGNFIELSRENVVQLDSELSGPNFLSTGLR